MRTSRGGRGGAEAGGAPGEWGKVCPGRGAAGGAPGGAGMPGEKAGGAEAGELRGRGPGGWRGRYLWRAPQ